MARPGTSPSSTPADRWLYPSITCDGDDHPAISYFRKTSGDLRVARFNGSEWIVTAVDTFETVGRSTDIAYNKNTRELAVAYEDSTHGWLKIARNNGGAAGADAWTPFIVESHTHGVTYTSLAFDPSNRPSISYYDIFRADLKFAHYNGANG